VFYEVSNFNIIRNIYGQVEQIDGILIIGTKARQGQFDQIPKGPTNIKYNDPDAVQETFVQQRGLESNRLGKTNDKRDLIANGVLENEPPEGAREVSPRGDTTGAGSSFYDEDE
jgi:hypothetical protein